MPIYRPPDLDWAAPITDPASGRVTPYFQRFWQEMSFTAADGGSASPAISALQADIATINGQITVINATLTGKAPLASPAFTGTPTAPTAAAGTNTTQIATTAFVRTESVRRATFSPFAAATGTATRTTFDTATVTLPELAERVKALIDDLKV